MPVGAEVPGHIIDNNKNTVTPWHQITGPAPQICSGILKLHFARYPSSQTPSQVLVSSCSGARILCTEMRFVGYVQRCGVVEEC